MRRNEMPSKTDLCFPGSHQTQNWVTSGRTGHGGPCSATRIPCTNCRPPGSSATGTGDYHSCSVVRPRRRTPGRRTTVWVTGQGATPKPHLEDHPSSPTENRSGRPHRRELQPSWILCRLTAQSGRTEGVQEHPEGETPVHAVRPLLSRGSHFPTTASTKD